MRSTHARNLFTLAVVISYDEVALRLVLRRKALAAAAGILAIVGAVVGVS